MFLRNYKKKFYKQNNYSFLKFPIRFIIDFDPKKDYYKILGVLATSTDKEIKSAYYKLAKKYHPDVNGGIQTTEFKEMTNAYDILSDQKKREEYDTMRKSGYTDESKYNAYNDKNKNESYYYRDQNSYNSNYNTNDYEERIRERFKNSGFSRFYSKYSKYEYKDPKTGEWKSFSNTQGNPFFKDFENLFRKGGYNKNKDSYYYDDQKYYEQQNKKSKDDPFRNYWERNKNYNNRFKKKTEDYHQDHDPNRFNNNTYNPFNRDPNNSNINNFNDFNNILIYTFLKRMFFVFGLFWIFTFLSRRRYQNGYYYNQPSGLYPPNSYDPFDVPPTFQSKENYDPFDPKSFIKTK